MPDLTLFELSELKKEDIKTRLLEDFNCIRHRNNTLDDMVSPGIAGQRNMKSIWQNIKAYIAEHLKSILLKRKPFLP